MNVMKLDLYFKNTFRLFLFILAAAMPFYIFPTEFAFGVLFLCWLGRLVITKQIKLKRIGLEYAFLAYLLAELIALVFSTNFWQSVEYLKRFLLIPLVYIIATGVEDEKDLKNALYIFVMATGLYSLMGIISYINNPVRVHLIHNSMTAGGITMTGALAGIATTFYIKKLQWKIGFLFLVLLNCFCLIFTATRSSWVGFFVGIIVIFYHYKKRLLLLIPLFFIIIYFIFPTSYKDRVTSIFNPEFRTNQFRLEYWKIGFEIFKDHPIVGIGDVGTGEMYDQYNTFSKEKTVGHFHNNFVHIAVTLGSIGLAAFTFMIIVIFYRLIKQLKKIKDAWPLAALAIFAAFNINGLFEWNFGDQEIITIIWFTIGAALWMNTNRRQITKSSA